MTKLNKGQKNILIGGLIAVVLVMTITYAAFASNLTITGTSNITSNWNVKITGITKTAGVGATDQTGSPSYNNTNGLSATFNTILKSPGDYATYKVEITNSGSIDAKLTNIEIPASTNNDIVFYVNKDNTNGIINGALKQNDTLYKAGGTGNVGYVYVTVLYRNYEGQTSPEAGNNSVTATISFTFEQATGGTLTPSESSNIVYSKNILTGADDTESNYIFLGDPITKITNYTTDPSTLGDYYLKHNMTNGQVESNEVCFIKDSQTYCLKPNEFETSKATLLTAFGESACVVNDSVAICNVGSFNANAIPSGTVAAGDDSTGCGVYSYGGAFCHA